MTQYWKIGAIALLALATLAPAASAAPQFRVGVRVGGPRFFGPRYFGPSFYAGPRFYGPGWYGAGYYGLGWYEPYGYVPAPVAGKVKFDTKMKDAQVYVDGAYAGTASQLRSFPLKAGTHDLELRAPTGGQTMYSEHVDVIAGRTLKIKI